MTAFARNLRIALLAALVLISLPALAQTAAQFTISGDVVNAQTGQPVPHADVTILTTENSHALMSAVADGNGHFVLPGLPAARYQLTASRRGYVIAFYLQHGDFNSAIVTGPNQDTTHLVFRLAPNALISGVIRDGAGDPVEKAGVLLFRKPAGPAERIKPAGTAITDDTGAYEFGSLDAGQYLLAAQAQPWYALHSTGDRAVNPSLDVAYPLTYYDSTTDESAATPIELAAGARVEANLTLQAVPALHLHVDAPPSQNGAPLPLSLHQLAFGTELNGGGSSFARNLSTGSGEIASVAPGHYELQMGDPPRLIEFEAETSGPVDPNQGAPLLAVNGHLLSASGAPLPAQLSVLLNRIDTTGDRQPVSMSARNGSFSFQAPSGSQWQLVVINTAHPDASLTVLSVHAGAQSQPGDRFTVGSQPFTLTAEVSAAAARVTGFARKEGKPFAGAMIVLVPRGPAAQDPQAFAALIRRDQSDSDGSFALPNAVPGSYSVVAIRDGWSLDWTSPAVLSRYLPSGVPVIVLPDSAASISLSASVPVENP